MFEWIEIIVDFWKDLFTAYNLYLPTDLTLIVYDVGTSSMTLYEYLVLTFSGFTLIWAVLLTFNFIRRMGRLLKRMFKI